MSMEKTTKNRLLSLAALAMLFFALWTFCIVELTSAQSVPFVIECVFLFVIYALTFFNIPLFIPIIAAILGCVGMGYLYAVSPDRSGGEFFYPATYLFAFFFYVEQLCLARGKGDTGAVRLLSWLSRVLPIIFAGAVVAVFADDLKEKLSFYHYYIYYIVAYILAFIVYLVFASAKVETKQSKKKKKQQPAEDGFGPMRISFVFTLVPFAASCFLFILSRTFSGQLIYAVPVLWMLNLVLLYNNAHPLVCARVDGVRAKIENGLKD